MSRLCGDVSRWLVGDVATECTLPGLVLGCVMAEWWSLNASDVLVASRKNFFMERPLSIPFESVEDGWACTLLVAGVHVGLAVACCLNTSGFAFPAAKKSLMEALAHTDIHTDMHTDIHTDIHTHARRTTATRQKCAL